MEEWKMGILYMLSAKITLLFIPSPGTQRSKQWNYEGLINTDQYLSGKVFDWMLREGIYGSLGCLSCTKNMDCCSTLSLNLAMR